MGTAWSDRGQTGIETLAVFVAMVFVAAITATLLINTAGFFQGESDETGEDTAATVANNLVVVGESGDVATITTEYNSTAGEVQQTGHFVYEISLMLQPSPGAGPINTTGFSIQYVGDSGYGTLVHASEADEPVLNASETVTAVTDSDRGEEGYVVTAVTAETTDDAVMTADSDRYRLVIPTGIAYLENETSSVIGFDPSGRAAEDNLPDGGDIVQRPDPSGISYEDVLAGVDGPDDEFGLDNTELGLIAPGESTLLQLTTADGAQRPVRVTAPTTLSGDAGETVEL